MSVAARLTAQDQHEPESARHAEWDWLKRGHPYANIHYRFETLAAGARKLNQEHH